MIRRLFSDYPIFYRFYFHLIRKNKGIRPDYFSSSTDIFYDGYPRSGNTFLYHLFKNVFPDLNCVHHLHKVAPIKIALNSNIPVFILVRDPKEAISSNYLKYYAQHDKLPKSLNEKLLKRMIEDYHHYYYYVLKKCDDITIILFRDLIKSPVNTMRCIGNKLNLKIVKEDKFKIIVKTAAESYEGAKTKYGSSKPNIYKELEKNKLKMVLFQFENYKKVNLIYNEIINKYG